MKNVTVIYNGSTCEDYACFLNDYPVFSGGAKVYNTYAVPGRDGELVESMDYLQNLTVSCTFSVVSKQFMEMLRYIRKWLSGTGRLVISDNPDIFYKVLKVEHGDITREIRKFGTFTVSFVCVPFEFLLSGQEPVQGTSFYNAQDTAKPVYTITGEGFCTLTVNSYEFTANIGQGAIINSELMLSYKNDGRSINTDVTGDYEKLWFPPGDIEVSVSSGFMLSIVPQWGYRI